MVISRTRFSFGVIVVYAQEYVFSNSVVRTNAPAFITTITAKCIQIESRAQPSVNRLVIVECVQTIRTNFIASTFVVQANNVTVFGNILIVFANIPLLYLGAKYVFKATKHYKSGDETPFTSKTIGSDKLYWDEK